MKRAWKIIGISLGSIIGLVLIVAAIAVWLVFTPEKLTPIARQAADKYILCEHEIGDVDLTFFSTFPEFGLRIDGLCLVNPMEGAPSDTLAYAPEVVAKVDVVEFLKRKNLSVHTLELENLEAAIYINQEGENNFSVFLTNPDTLDEDTTAFKLPFDEIEVRKLSISAKTLVFKDEKDTLDAHLGGTEIKAKVADWDNANLKMGIESATVDMKGVRYADNLSLAMDMPMGVDLDNMHFTLHDAAVKIQDYKMKLDGHCGLKPEITVDMAVAFDKWQIKPLLELIPQPFTAALKDINVDGQLSMEAKAKGVYNEESMPIIDARVEYVHGNVKYSKLPYTIEKIDAAIEAHLDLKHGDLCTANIERLNAKTKNTEVGVKGEVRQLLGDIWPKLTIKANGKFEDFAYFMPKNMALEGPFDANVLADIKLSDITAKHLDRGTISGKIEFPGMDFKMDSMVAQIVDKYEYRDANVITFQIPNPTATKKDINWVNATINLHNLTYQMVDKMEATLGETALRIEANDVLNEQNLKANISLQNEGKMIADMDTIHAELTNTNLTAQVEYMSKTKEPSINTTIKTDGVKANMGKETRVETSKLKMTASAKQNKAIENILLQWNPKLRFDLHDAVIDLPEFAQTIRIPQINFDYTNRLFQIATSSIKIGRSDFSLTGAVRNLGNWIQDKGVLNGELNFTSDHTDVNELMALVSAKQGSEEEAEGKTPAVTEETQTNAKAEEKGPFLVPNRVDLTLNTHIKEAIVFNQTARNLGGKIYVNNGTLVLEEMGFVCNAARLQLTAMYKTPRTNHLYLGLDYHMLDVNIEELIGMIPQLDTMIPMLKSFKGEAEFHLAAETYLDKNYQIKPSTIRGACSLYGKDLVVLDSETFSKISKLLMFNKKTENKVDSISAEITLYKKEIDVYPFTVSMDNYMVALGGRHNLDMSFDYHINVLSPIYLGVDVKGTMDNLDISLGKCIYAKDFKPLFHGKVDTQSAELRTLIRESMRKNVKEQAKEGENGNE